MYSLPVPLDTSSKHQTAFNLPPQPNYKASLPVPSPTRSFWSTDPTTSPSPSEGSEGLLTEDADICIIGSGITGCSAAYHLAKTFKHHNIAHTDGRPITVAILEARDFCTPPSFTTICLLIYKIYSLSQALAQQVALCELLTAEL